MQASNKSSRLNLTTDAAAGPRVRAPQSTKRAVLVAASPVSEPDVTVPKRTFDFDLEDLVDVSVPRDYTLMRDDSVQVRYTTTTRSMPRCDAEHDYSKANGVEMV